jgi:hypothetical protein
MSSSGISILSYLTGEDLRLVDLPLRLDMSVPKIFLALFTSSVVTGQFLIAFILMSAYNDSIVGVPTI